MRGLRRIFFAFWAWVFRTLSFGSLGITKGFEWLADRCEERAR